MALEDLAERLIRRGTQALREGARAAAGAASMVRGTGVLSSLTAQGLAAAAAAVAAGDHPYAVVLTLHAQGAGERAALIHGDRVVTWAQLLQRFNQASHALESLGVAPGDRVAVMMGNCPEWVIGAAAAGNVGASLVPVAVGLKAGGLDYLLDHARPRAILTDAERWPVVAEATAARPELRRRTLVLGGASLKLEGALPLEVSWDEAPQSPLPAPDGRALFPGVTMYTSGTTGRPKGVERTDVSVSLEIVHTINGLMEAFAFAASDVTLLVSPLYHAAPLLFLGVHLALGATVVLGRDAHAATILETLERWQVTNALLVPTVLARLASHEPAPRPEAFPRLRAIFSTADRLPIPTAEAIRERFGDVLYDCYGSTETGIVTMASPRDLREHPGTVGRALPGAIVRLIGEGGAEVGVGEPGELFARTGIAMGGYRGDPDATRSAAHGGLYTVGDVATRDIAGFYYIVGRSAQLIISGGVNVYPAEIEGVIMSHPAISEAAVVGVPHPEWGEKVVAVVVARGDVKVAELRAFAASRLTKPQQPKEYRFWDALPASPQGKIDKRAILARLTEGGAR